MRPNSLPPTRGELCYNVPTENTFDAAAPACPRIGGDFVNKFRRFAVLPIAMLVLAACQGDAGGSPSGQASEPAEATESAAASGSAAAEGPICDSDSGDDHLGRICEAGTIVVSTDPAYPPQSSLNAETGEYEGFDIDVANEIGERLGVEVEFTDPPFDAVQAGNWAGPLGHERRLGHDHRDAAGGPRLHAAVLLHAGPDGDDRGHRHRGARGLLRDRRFVPAEATTYFDWMEGTLTLTEDAGEVTEPPADITSTTLPTDINCAEAWQAGRTEFQGWLSSSTTAQGAIDEGYPVVPVGDPVFFEPLAVCFDAAVEDNDSLVEAVDQIVTDMHEDGTLAGFSEDWFGGLDLTTQE